MTPGWAITELLKLGRIVVASRVDRSSVTHFKDTSGEHLIICGTTQLHSGMRRGST